jgi:CRISPR/Cas system-associated exonuclease Cas4 (RecB family)
MKIKFEIYNPTLEAIDLVLEKKGAAAPARGWLGPSSLGRKCERKLWYDFRGASRPGFSAAALKRFEDGHTQEAVQAKRLELVPGVKITGRQLEAKLAGGHIRGHCDGVIEGLLEAPTTPHIWEHKSCETKKFQQLRKLLESTDEKKVLELWDDVYYCQAILYMDLFCYKRHFLTVSTPGGRESLSCRTNCNSEKAKKLKKKALEIVFAEEPPPRFEGYYCNFCSHKNICLEKGTPEANCRTCLYSTPEENGEWSCHKKVSPMKFCRHHLFIPAIINSEQVGCDETDSDILYIDYEIGRNSSGSGCVTDISSSKEGEKKDTRPQ